MIDSSSLNGDPVGGFLVICARARSVCVCDRCNNFLFQKKFLTNQNEFVQASSSSLFFSPPLLIADAELHLRCTKNEYFLVMCVCGETYCKRGGVNLFVNIFNKVSLF